MSNNQIDKENKVYRAGDVDTTLDHTVDHLVSLLNELNVHTAGLAESYRQSAKLYEKYLIDNS